MKTKPNPTQNTLREPIRRAMIDTSGKAGDADTADLFTGVSRGVDKLLWLVEARMQAKEWNP